MLEKHCFRSVFSGKTPAFWYSLFNGNKKRSSAFTLTEMLIALVIIAVLAVLILPVVTTRAQNKSFAMSYESQVKQLLNSLIGLNVYENVPQFQDTMMFQESMPDNFDASSGTYIKKYMKVSKYCGSNHPGGCFAGRYSVFEDNDKKVHEGFIKSDGTVNGSVGACALLKNGVSICLKPQTRLEDGGITDIAGWLDLNGPKGPNVYGRDLRPFRVNLNDRIAFNPETPDVVIVPGNPPDCIGSECIEQNECQTNPASEKCCLQGGSGGGVKVPAGPNDPCCVWHMNPNKESDKANYNICNPGEETTEKTCENETITFGHRCCFNSGEPEGTIKDPVCCGSADNTVAALSQDDFCCTKFGYNSLNCCWAHINSGKITLTKDDPCCTHPEIQQKYPNQCFQPCELDKQKLGDQRFKYGYKESENSELQIPSQNCCDTIERRRLVLNPLEQGPKDACCMYEKIQNPEYNPLSADLCCRKQIFPKRALNGRTPQQIEDICCSWRFDDKDLNGKSWLKPHDFISGETHSIYNDTESAIENESNNFDSCCFYALGKVINSSSNSVWSKTTVQDKVWKNCCSLGSLSLPNETANNQQKREYTEHCCHFLVNADGAKNKYGEEALMEIDTRTGSEGALRKYCCALDEFKDSPQCCSSTQDGINPIRQEYTDVCCMPNSFYGVRPAPSPETSALNLAEAPAVAPWCCLYADGNANSQSGSSGIQYERKSENKKLWDERANLGSVDRLHGCCSQGTKEIPNIKGEGTGKQLRSDIKWKANCCQLPRWKDNNTATGYQDAEAYVEGCCVENAIANRWENYKDDGVDGPLMEDCCLAYGSPTDKQEHSRNDKRWWERCCSESKSSIADYKFYYTDLGCCKNVHWWIKGDEGAPGYITDEVNCCKSSKDARTDQHVLEFLKGKNPDKDWLSNCCKYVDLYKNVGDEKKGYQLFVENCCYHDKETEHDGNRLEEYGGINTENGLIGKHKFLQNENPFEKHCCDINIAEGNQLDPTTGEAPESAAIPGEKCCWHFLTDPEGENLTKDYDENPLSTNYRGYCCKAYGNSSNNPLHPGDSTVTFRNRAYSLDEDCEALWICGGNGTDRSDTAALQTGNTIGFGLPGCCVASKGHNTNTNWKNGCCENPTYYESNVVYRENCCNGDYVRHNPGKNDASIEQGKNNAIPYDSPDGPADILDKGNAWAFCCDPDVADNGGTPKIECCKWFHNKDKNYAKNNEYFTTDGPKPTGKKKGLSKEYQIACCNLTEDGVSVNSKDDLCSTCAIRWETGITQQKKANAFGATDAWQYYNFSGCCKSIHNDNNDLTLSSGKVSEYANTEMWLDNCCTFVGDTVKDINKYYGSHEKFRKHCCVGGVSQQTSQCYPASEDKVSTDGCCDIWSDDGETLANNPTLVEKCCNAGAFNSSSNQTGWCGCSESDITITDFVEDVTPQNSSETVSRIRLRASSAVKQDITVKYPIAKKDCSHKATPEISTVSITIKSGETESSATQSYGHYDLKVNAKDCPANQVVSKQWILIDKDHKKDYTVPDSSCPAYTFNLTATVAEPTGTLYCPGPCDTVSQANAASCCATWYADANKKTNADVKSYCCALDGFQSDDEKKLYCCGEPTNQSSVTSTCCNLWVSNNKTFDAATKTACCSKTDFTNYGKAECCPDPHANNPSVMCCNKWVQDWDAEDNVEDSYDIGGVQGRREVLDACCTLDGFVEKDKQVCCPDTPTGDNPSLNCCNYWHNNFKFKSYTGPMAGQYIEEYMPIARKCCAYGEDYTGKNESYCCPTPKTDNATEYCCAAWLDKDLISKTKEKNVFNKCCESDSFGGENHDALCGGGGGDDTCSPISKENATAECCQQWWNEHGPEGANDWKTALQDNVSGYPNDIIEACCSAGVGTDYCCNMCGKWRLIAESMGGTYYDGFSIWSGFKYTNAPSGTSLRATGSIYMTCADGITTHTSSGTFDLGNNSTAYINVNFGNPTVPTGPIILYPTCSISGIDLVVKDGERVIYSKNGVTSADIIGNITDNNGENVCKMQIKEGELCNDTPVIFAPIADTCDTHTTANANTICCNKWAADSGLWTSIPYAVRDKCCADIEGLQVEGDQCTCIGGFSVGYRFDTEFKADGQSRYKGRIEFNVPSRAIPDGYSVIGAAVAPYTVIDYPNSPYSNQTATGELVYNGAPNVDSSWEYINCKNTGCAVILDGGFSSTFVRLLNEDNVQVATDTCGKSPLDDSPYQMMCPGGGSLNKACHWVAKHPDCEDYPIQESGVSADGCACWMGIDNQWSQLSSDQKQSCCALNHNENRCLYGCADHFDFSVNTMWDSSARFRGQVYISNSNVSISDIDVLQISGTARCVLQGSNDGSAEYVTFYINKPSPTSDPNGGYYYSDSYGSKYTDCNINNVSAMVQYKTDAPATASSSINGLASGSYSGRCWPRPKTSFNDSIKYAMNSAKDKFFAKAPQTTVANADTTVKKAKNGKITVNRKNRHVYVNGIDTGVIRPTIWQNIASAFSQFTNRIASGFRTFVARTFGIQISARKPQHNSGGIDADAANRLTAGKYQQGSTVWAEGEEVEAELQDPRNESVKSIDQNGKKLSAYHCCTPNHSEPSKYCCEHYRDNDWMDDEIGDDDNVKEAGYLSTAYKTYCCKKHGICPKVKECKPEYANSNNKKELKIYSDCVALYNTGDPEIWTNNNQGCCACLYSRALKGTQNSTINDAWRDMCCPYAAGQDTRESDKAGSETEKRTGLQPGEFKTYCCPSESNKQNGKIKDDNSLNDERCCNYASDQSSTSSEFCCGQYAKKADNKAFWGSDSLLTNTTQENADGTGYDESGKFKYACCNADWNKNNKYCSCNQMFNKFNAKENTQEAFTAASKNVVNAFGDNLSACCGNLYDTNGSGYFHKGNGVWMGACCQDARTHGDTVFANRAANTSVDKAFRDICCVKPALNGNVHQALSNEDKYKDERCCNFASAASANAFCCSKKAAGGVTQSTDPNSSWGTDAWTVTGTGNTGDEETSVAFRQACCTGNKSDNGSFDGNDEYCTCTQLYDKYGKDASDDSAKETAAKGFYDSLKNATKRATCCQDLYANNNDAIWKMACCPVAQANSTRAKSIFKKYLDSNAGATYETAFRQLCCQDKSNACYYHYFMSTNCETDPDINNTSLKDYRCCSGNANAIDAQTGKYNTDGMPTKADNRLGSGNYYCCAKLDADTKSTYQGHSENARLSGCCRPDGEEGLRWGGGKDPQCCSYKVGDSQSDLGNGTYAGRTSVTEYCCKARRDGLNTDENATVWSPLTGDMNDSFRQKCCELISSSSISGGNQICTCNYYYNKGADFKDLYLMQDKTEGINCCTALFLGGYNIGDSKRYDDYWKSACCYSSFSEIEKDHPDQLEDWRTSCCSYMAKDANSIVYNNDNYTTANKNFGCCTWRFEHSTADNQYQYMLMGDKTDDFYGRAYGDWDLDACCEAWKDKYEEDETKSGKYFSHCCSVNSSTVGCCEYMYAKGEKRPFYPGSPCCTNNPDMADKPECLDFCQRLFGKDDNGNAYSSFYIKDDSNYNTAIEVSFDNPDSDYVDYVNEEKRKCCAEAFNTSSDKYMADDSLVQQRCCLVPSKNGQRFAIEDEVCCDYRSADYGHGGGKIYFYSPEAFENKTCTLEQMDDGVCSPYKDNDKFYCGEECDFDNPNEYCCQAMIDNGIWGADDNYDPEDACCRLFEDTHNGKCRKTCSSGGGQEQIFDVKVKITRNLTGSTCTFTLSVDANAANTMDISDIGAYFNTKCSNGYYFGNSYSDTTIPAVLNMPNHGYTENMSICSKSGTDSNSMPTTYYDCPLISGIQIISQSQGPLACDSTSGLYGYDSNCKRNNGVIVDASCQDWEAVRPACFEYRNNNSASEEACGCWMKNEDVWNDLSSSLKRSCCKNYYYAGPERCARKCTREYDYSLLVEPIPIYEDDKYKCKYHYTSTIVPLQGNAKITPLTYPSGSGCSPISAPNDITESGVKDAIVEFSSQDARDHCCQGLSLHKAMDNGSGSELGCQSTSRCEGHYELDCEYVPTEEFDDESADNSIKYAKWNIIDRLIAKIRSIWAMIFSPNNITSSVK